MPEQSPSADRALRDLTQGLGEARPRVADDGTDPDVPVAATVMLLRDSAAGPEVLMMERPDRGSFAGAWVFPGGKLDPADRIGGDEPEEDAARRAAVRETAEETGLAVDPDALLTVSVWDPPPALPLRIRTWFFAVRAEAGEIVLSPDEAVAAEWLRPEALLDRHARGEATLYPPTWVTLHGLSGQGDVEALLGRLRLAGVRRYETVARRAESGVMLLWQGDAEYGDEAPVLSERQRDEAPVLSERQRDDASARHRLEIGTLPWVYTRTG